MKISSDLSSYLQSNLDYMSNANLENGLEILLYLILMEYTDTLRQQDIKLDLGGGVLDYPAKIQTTTLPDNPDFNDFIYITLFIPNNSSSGVALSPIEVGTLTDVNSTLVVYSYY